MSTQAQLAANRANAQHSTGPQSAEGKATISLNAIRHGLTGAFIFLPGEKPEAFDKLQNDLLAEHQPETATETLLVESMAQHYWLQQRAVRLQSLCFDEAGLCEDERALGLYMRYQTTHERAFHKALNTLLKLRAEKRKSGIGFVSQKAQEACNSGGADAPSAAGPLTGHSVRNRGTAAPQPAPAPHAAISQTTPSLDFPSGIRQDRATASPFRG